MRVIATEWRTFCVTGEGRYILNYCQPAAHGEMDCDVNSRTYRSDIAFSDWPIPTYSSLRDAMTAATSDQAARDICVDLFDFYDRHLPPYQFGGPTTADEWARAKLNEVLDGDLPERSRRLLVRFLMEN